MTDLLLDSYLAAPPANGPMQWGALSFGILTILYIAVIRPMRKGKSRPDPLEHKPTKSSLAQQRAIERDMGNLLVQYEEMIRRMTAQVDIRATKLEMLIQDAEEKIARLKALNGIANSESGQTGSTGSPQPGSSQAGLSQAASLQPGPGQLPKDHATASATANSEPGPFRNGQAKSSAPVEAPLPDGEGTGAGQAGDDGAGKIDDRHSEIYRLADGGRTPRQIAQELNRPHGEVELILHLRSHRPRQGDLWEQPPAAEDAMPGQAEVSNAPEPPPPGSADPRRKGRKKQKSTGG